MKRLSGTVVLLAGLSGCVSFMPPPGAGGKEGEERPGLPGAAAPGMAMMNNAAAANLPTNPTWMADPGHQSVPGRPSGQVAGRLQASNAPVNPALPPAVPPPVPAPQIIAIA